MAYLYRQLRARSPFPAYPDTATFGQFSKNEPRFFAHQKEPAQYPVILPTFPNCSGAAHFEEWSSFAHHSMASSPGSRFPFMRHWRMMAMTFIETSSFSRWREKYLDDEHFRLLQASLMRAPDAGVMMKGSGGIRKLRWGTEGSGKRGGLRVIYYWPRESSRIYLMAIYRKTEMADLSKAELRQLKSLLREIETGIPGE